MSNKTFRVFGLNYDNVTIDEAAGRIEEFIKEKTPHMVLTTGAELVSRAYKDSELKKIYASSDMLTVDSYVVYFACKLLGKPVKEPVSAAKLILRQPKLKATDCFSWEQKRKYWKKRYRILRQNIRI